MNVKLLLVVCGACLLLGVQADNNCQGTPNMNPIYTEDPTLLRSVPNGKLFVTGPENLNPQIYVAHLYGTPYQMGYAHGALLKDQINAMLPRFFQYLYDSIDQYLQFLPQWLRQIIEVYGINAALDVTYELTKPHIAQYFIDEVQGLADGAGLNFTQIMRLTLFPELIQARCSMMGAWGAAIKGTNGTLYQLRALDWSTDSPLQEFVTLFVYHPTEAGNGHAFATFSWAGFVGSITGYSSADVGICEKVWIHYTGKQNRAGIPFHFLLRDILQFDGDVQDAINRIESANRTCSIFVGVGAAATNTFNAIEYSYEIVQVFNDSNMANHTQFQDVVYVDKHTQPSSDPCMPALIDQYYGQLDPNNIIRYITAQFQTGDMHIAIYDYSESLIYLASASPSVNGTATPAYDRPFTMVDLNKAFSEPAPSGL